MGNTIPHPPANITKSLSTRIYSCIRGLKDANTESVLEFLYMAYAEEQGQDSAPIRQYSVDLDNRLQVLSLEKNNEIFAIVCSICSAYEKRAFMDGVQVATSLVLELQGN